jgi:hypothetical protein
MKARTLIESASLGPDALKAVCQAFDAAWQAIEGNFESEGPAREAARIRLAEAMLSIAHEDSRDVEALKHGALEAMAMEYQPRHKWKPSGTPDISN